MLAGEGETAILTGVFGVPVWFLATFVALLGLAFGSFLNVCIARLPRHASIVRPGSRCPKCGMAIRVRDNVPVLSWLVLRGKCRDCGWRIPWRYPAVEVVTAAFFLLCFLWFGVGLFSFGMMVFCFLLLGLAVMDAETLRLPNAFTWPGIGLGIVWSGLLMGIARQFPEAFRLLPGLTLGVFSSGPHFSYMRAGVVAALLSGVWALLAGLGILLIRWAYLIVRGREGMGLGDAKLLAMIAAWLGPALTVLTMFLGVMAASVVGLLLVRFSQRKAAAAQVPFGAFLCGAAIYAIFAGEPLIEWYLKFFR
ncbi:MAG: prepilin peptidase [Acidobacteriaceae bacterium]